MSPNKIQPEPYDLVGPDWEAHSDNVRGLMGPNLFDYLEALEEQMGGDAFRAKMIAECCEAWVK